MKKARQPAITVEQKAMRVVTPRSLPADLPKSAIPGIMKPTMIRGIVKPKKLPKIELNVAKILTILGKLRFPITIPKIIPRIRRGSKPSFFM